MLWVLEVSVSGACCRPQGKEVHKRAKKGKRRYSYR